jgi:hypothetical protein
MGNKVQKFRQHEVSRAIRGAAAAGMKNPSVEVRLPGGTSIVLGGPIEAREPAISKPARAAHKPASGPRTRHP